MKILVVKDYDEMSRKAADIMINQIKTKPNSTLGLATGGTPIGLYKNLIKSYQAKEISFENIKTYNLDEYCGIDKTHPQSYYFYMHDNLFNHVDVKSENVHIPAATSDNVIEQANAYNRLLKEANIDIQVLGIGSNGHIGFNEPGTPFDQETFMVELAEKTREDNRRFFNSIDEVPRYAITMGIKNIMEAKSILLLISGKGKQETVKRLLSGDVSTDFPASILHKHNDVTVIIDEEAYALMTK